PLVRDLFGSDYRMASWGARFDLTRNDPDDPAYVENWRKAMEALKSSPAPAELARAVSVFFSNPDTQEVSEAYQTWLGEAVPVLQAAPSSAEFRRILEEQLDVLMVRMNQADNKFRENLAALRRGLLNYTTVRDDLLQAIQSHKASLEYTNQHPLNQPSSSNLRFIYSHKPSKSETLLTLNMGFTTYNSLPSGLNSSRIRDLQFAGQLDRHLGEIPSLGRAVATFGVYYQWMKDDALIVIGPGNIAPGSGIVLPGTAATLLGTKGHIGIVQGKLSIPVNSIVKVPISVTWSNRTELIKEKDLRGQVGLTLDMDSVFKR
ncbi:MAG: hypothetical protein ACRD8O_05405, partial [Bryobacteraceae bacterium]